MRIFLTIGLWSVFAALAVAQQQPCADCDCIIQNARSLGRAGQYEAAINKLTAAKACAPARSAEIDSLIVTLFEQVDGLRAKAEQAEKEALEQAAIAKKRELEAKRARDIAKRAEEAVRQEQKKTLISLQRAEEERNRASNLLNLFQKNNLLAAASEVSTAGGILDQCALVDSLIKRSDGLDEALKTILTVSNLYTRASAYSTSNNHEKAIAATSEILEMDSFNIVARSLRMVSYFRIYQFEKSLADADFMLRYQPSSLIALINRNILLGYLGRIEEAQQETARLIENPVINTAASLVINNLSPAMVSATGNTSLRVVGASYKSAMQIYLMALKSIDGQFDIFNIDDRYFSDPNVVLYVIHLLEIHVKTRPEDYGLLATISILWGKSGFQAQSEQAAEQFKSAHLTYKNPAYDQFEVLLTGGSATQPVKINTPPNANDDLIDDLRGAEFAAVQQYSEALDYVKKAIQHNPDNPYYLEEAAAYSYQLGNLEETIEYCNRLIEVAPNHASAYSQRGWARHHLGQYDNAYDDIITALKLDPFDFLAVEFAAWLTGNENKMATLAYYKRLLQIIPGIIWVYDLMKPLSDDLGIDLNEYLKKGN